MREIKRLGAVAVVSILVTFSTATATAGPITKQNGSSPVFSSFTSICAVPGYADYGLCGGNSATFSEVAGRIDAIQSKPGRYNLDIAFTGLAPGVEYRLHGNQGAFFSIGTGTADGAGRISFSYQTDNPEMLGFDLNTLQGDVTIVTSFWSNQLLRKRSDGTLYVP